MSIHEPPVLPTRILEWVVGRTRGEALIGDLVEEYQVHRSTLEYSRQVGVAVCRACLYTIREHPYATARDLVAVVAAGQLFWWMYTWAIADAYFGLLWSLPPALRLPTMIAVHDAFPGLAIGLLAARLPRQNAALLVLLTAIVVVAQQSPEFWRRLVNAFENSRYLEAFAVHVLQTGIAGMGVILGGVWSPSRLRHEADPRARTHS